MNICVLDFIYLFIYLDMWAVLSLVQIKNNTNGHVSKSHEALAIQMRTLQRMVS